MLTFNQKDNQILTCAVYSKENIFIHGPAGVGKSELIKEITRRIKDRNVVVTATTGVAALNIKGTTLHRFAGIGLGKEDAMHLLKRVMSKKKYVIRWRKADVLIIDEISMLGAELFDKLDFIARRVRGKSSPMGGLQIILSGDLLQLPPIKDGWIFNSKTWESLNLTTFNLKTPKRYDNSEYFEMLLRIRENQQTKADINALNMRFGEYLQIRNTIKDWEIKPTILHSLRVDVNDHNKSELSKLPGNATKFKARDLIDFLDIPDNRDMQTKYFKMLLDDAIPEEIQLKVGAQVMLRKNIDIDSGLVNGSRGVVKKILLETVIVKFNNGVTSEIGYEQWEITDDEAIVVREQIPLILAWSYTIHKSQGCTLDFAVCDLGKSVFANSQAYVALSRVRNLNSLYLGDFDPKSLRVDPEALEFVQKLDYEPNVETVLEFVDDTPEQPTSTGLFMEDHVESISDEVL